MAKCESSEHAEQIEMFGCCDSCGQWAEVWYPGETDSAYGPLS